MKFWGERWVSPDEQFKVVGSDRADSRRTRTAALVRFMEPLGTGLCFGEVKFFFSVDTSEEKGLQLAYVQTMPWERDTTNSLLIRRKARPAGNGRHIILPVSQIDDLIRVLHADKREFIVNKTSAFWSNN